MQILKIFLRIVLYSISLSCLLILNPVDLYWEKEVGPNPVARIDKVTSAVQISNPAGAYCAQLGYEYQIETRQDGSQDGVCVLPDQERCEAWDFYAGTCGQSFSVCSRQGLGTIALQDGKDPFSPRYTMCVDLHNGIQVASARTLAHVETRMGLNTIVLSPSLESLAPEAKDHPSLSSLPSSFDWRSYNGGDWLTPVKNQASCGSCWAFAAVAVAEAYENLHSNNPNLDLNLAEQNLVNCVAGSTCSGGSSSSALSYIRTNGIVDEACNPYTGQDASCGTGRCADWQNRLTKVGTLDVEWYPSSRDAVKQQILANGPAVVYIGVQSQFGGYFDGNQVYRCTKDNQSIPAEYGINHAVTAVGWNDVGQYWLIKNSWGTGWGTAGYFKLGYGECNVELYTVMNVVADGPEDVDATHLVTGTAGENGWYRSNLQVTITAFDSEGGFAGDANIYSSTDNGPWLVSSGGIKTVQVIGSGNHKVTYYAQIPNGNPGPVHIVDFKIDKDSPVAAWSQPNNNPVMFDDSLSIALDAIDGVTGSGVDRVELWVDIGGVENLITTDVLFPYIYTWLPGEVLEKGQWMDISARVWDKAGNQADMGEDSIQVYFGGYKLFLPSLIR